MTAWEKSDRIINTQMNRRGLHKTLVAVDICKQSEQLSPVIQKAISFKNGTLKVQIKPEDTVALKLAQGKIITDINSYAHAHGLPEVKRILIDIQD